MSASIPASSDDVQKKCSVKTCSYTIHVADSRKMCERCRNTQAEQSRKKRERKREKEDTAGTLIKRRASSKPKPPLYRIPNVGLFTERNWQHLDRRLFKFPKPVDEGDEEESHPPEPGPSRRKDGYVRNPPPAKEDGAKELVAVKICHIKGCYQPVPIDHKLACIDCHERKTSYTQERKRKRDLEKEKIITTGPTSNIQILQQPSTSLDQSSRSQPSDIPSHRNPSPPETSNEVLSQSQSIDIPPVLTPLQPPASIDEGFTLQLPNFPASAPHPTSHTPASAEVAYRTQSVNVSVMQAPLRPSSSHEQSFPDQLAELSGVSVDPTYETSHPNVSFERYQAPIAEGDQEPIVISSSDEEAEQTGIQANLEQSQHLLESLLLACRDGDEGRVKLLLNQGADIDAYVDLYGSGSKYNALQIASCHGQQSIVRLLLTRGAEVNFHGGYHGSALQVACLHGAKSLVTLLIGHGADINAQGGHYGNALQAACFNGNKSLVKLLLVPGVDINAQGGFYGNALQAASRCGYEPVVRLLLDSGADINAQGGEYGNALHAARTCWTPSARATVVQLLLSCGAVDPEI